MQSQPMLESGKTIQHYRLIAKIGSGGMGVVWKARDLALDRTVALKFLPPELSSSPESLERFRREARTVASLNHASIVTLFSVEEADGLRFLTMELVEGRSLDAELGKGGLGLTRLLQIGMRVADALDAAHRRQILHRDLKPANIMVSREGQVKLLDFGLAKLRDEAGESGIPTAEIGSMESLTASGVFLGTIPYASPEQLAGGDLDARSDLFSLGSVLFEMATGRRPFLGTSGAELISAIMKEPAPPLSTLRPDLPHQLGRIVNHCLQKRPEDRFQTARDVYNELRELRDEITFGEKLRAVDSARSRPAPAGSQQVRLQGASWWRRDGARWGAAVGGLLTALVAVWLVYGPAGHNPGVAGDRSATGAARQSAEASVAVLPFTSLPEGERADAFATGLADELRTTLGRVRGVKVAARRSSAAAAGEDASAEEVGRRLGVGHLLEGAVHLEGDEIHVRTHLIDVATGFSVWSREFNRPLASMLAVEREIASSVAAELTGTVLTPDAEALQAYAGSPEAYELYLQARFFAGRATPESYQKAIGYFRQALAVDGSYARAWAGLARVYSNQGAFGFVPAGEGFGKAREAADRALDLDPDLAEALATVAWVELFHRWDWQAADRAVTKALRSDPGDLNALNTAAILAKTLGRFQEGIAHCRRMVELDPLGVVARMNLGLHLLYSGQLDEAAESFQKVLDLHPDYPGAVMNLGRVRLLQHRPEEALALMQSEKTEFWRVYGEALACWAVGDEAGSEAALASFAEAHGEESAYQVAEIHAFRGETDEAFGWLDRAYRQRDSGLIELRGDPLMAGLVDDERWESLLARLERPAP